MQQLFRNVIALLFAAAAAAAYADPPGRVGRLSFVSGAVSFASADAPGEWTQALLNRPVTGGDRISADRGGRGELHVGPTTVRFAALTNVEVLHLDEDRVQLRLNEGTLHVRARELDSDDVVEVETPAGAIVVRQPASYRIAAEPRGAAAGEAGPLGKRRAAPQLPPLAL